MTTFDVIVNEINKETGFAHPRPAENIETAAASGVANPDLIAGFKIVTETIMRKRKEVNNMSDSNVISSYTLEQAISDGVLVPIFQKRWRTLSSKKPIVATAHIFEEISQAGLIEIWNEYVIWRKNTMATLPEEEQMFTSKMDGKTVWVIEDDAAFTLLYPEDY